MVRTNRISLLQTGQRRSKASIQGQQATPYSVPLLRSENLKSSPQALLEGRETYSFSESSTRVASNSLTTTTPGTGSSTTSTITVSADAPCCSGCGLLSLGRGPPGAFSHVPSSFDGV